MKCSISLLLVFISFLLSCKNEGKHNTSPVLQGDPLEKSIPLSSKKDLAFQQLNSSLEKLISDRNEKGKMKKEYNSAIMMQAQEILHEFPKDDKSLELSSRAAELVKATEDYENAAKLYKLITTTFPKGEKVGYCLIQLGILLDTHLGNKTAAIAVYRTFIKDYPNHPFVGTAEGQLYELVRHNQKSATAN